jgi:hypothetical protein
VQGNITGSAQHKVKTINVEVNLLDAWVIQRADLELKVFRKALTLSLTVLAGILALPFAYSKMVQTGQVVNASESGLSADTKIKVGLEKQAKSVTPSIQMDEMVIRCHRFSNSYLNELTKVINAAPTQLYFEQFQTEVSNGECSIQILSNAANPDVGRDFVDRASKGTNVLSATQTSVRQSQMTPTSIKFDFIKRVSL